MAEVRGNEGKRLCPIHRAVYVWDAERSHSAAGAVPPLMPACTLGVQSAALPPSAVGRDKARYLAARLLIPPVVTVHATFTAHGGRPQGP